MIDLFLPSPVEMAHELAKNVRNKRLLLNFSQATLAKRSGVSLGTLKKFERTGRISLLSLLQLALVLDSLKEFAHLFPKHNPEKILTIKDLLKDVPRKRGRK